jgi:hypothetical protein
MRQLPSLAPEDPLAIASSVGSATHLLIGRLAGRFGVARSEEILRAGRTWLPAPGLAVPNRQALRAQVLSLTGVYFRVFGRPGWRLIASEQVVDDVALDLVWQRAGLIEVDEIKTGRLREADFERLRSQVIAQAGAGLREWGASFRGVRAVVLTRPATSFVQMP